MANHEDRTSGPPAPPHEHAPLAANRASFDDSPVVGDQPGAELRNLVAEVSRLMTDQKNRAADVLHRLACALGDTTQNLGQNDVGGQIATYSSGAAARMESISTYVRGADFSTMLRDAGRFARRRPEVLLAGSILTGLLVASLLKASRRGAAEPWTSATGRWHVALRKGTQAALAAADTMKQQAEARAPRPEAVVRKVTESRLGKYVAVAGHRRWRK